MTPRLILTGAVGLAGGRASSPAATQLMGRWFGLVGVVGLAGWCLYDTALAKEQAVLNLGSISAQSRLNLVSVSLNLRLISAQSPLTLERTPPPSLLPSRLGPTRRRPPSLNP